MTKTVYVKVKMIVTAPCESAIHEMIDDMDYSFESNFDDCKIKNTEIQEVEIAD